MLLHQVETALGVIEHVTHRALTNQFHGVATRAGADLEDAPPGQRSLGQGLIDPPPLVRIDLMQGTAVGPESLPVVGCGLALGAYREACILAAAGLWGQLSDWQAFARPWS